VVLPLAFAGTVGLLLPAAPPAAAQPVNLAQAQRDTAQLGTLFTRMGELEEEVRQLRGRIEELEHQLRQLEARPAGGIQALPPATAAAEPPPPASEPAPPVATAPAPTAELPADATPQQRYEAALQLLQDGRWDEAEQAFQQFIEANPEDPLASNAAYWLGETFYIRKDYSEAAAVFARNYRTYGPESPKAPDNLLKLGMSLAALGDSQRACQTFAELESRHPNAPAPIKQTLLRERTTAGCG
jgi:tol-pal system protein YbgF